MRFCIAFLFLNYKNSVLPRPFRKPLLYQKGIFNGKRPILLKRNIPNYLKKTDTKSSGNKHTPAKTAR